MANEDLPIEEVEGRMKIWKVSPYKDSMLYIRQIDHTIFEYLACWKGQIYADYIVITPREGEKELSKAEQNTAFQWILMAATTTVDTLRGEEVTGEKRKEAEDVLKVLEGTGAGILHSKGEERMVN